MIQATPELAESKTVTEIPNPAKQDTVGLIDMRPYPIDGPQISDQTNDKSTLESYTHTENGMKVTLSLTKFDAYRHKLLQNDIKIGMR